MFVNAFLWETERNGWIYVLILNIEKLWRNSTKGHRKGVYLYDNSTKGHRMGVYLYGNSTKGHRMGVYLYGNSIKGHRKGCVLGTPEAVSICVATRSRDTGRGVYLGHRKG